MADVSKIKLPDNSVVNIKDARITGVDNTPTSGSGNVVKSGGVKTALDGMIPYGATLMPTNPFGGKGVYINSMDNAFHSAEKRFWVKITLHSKTVSGVSYPYADTSKEITDPDYWVDSPVIYTFTNTQAANIFNGSYESNCQCPTGQYMKIHIQFSPFSDSWNPATAPRMSGYPYGSYYLSYYYQNTPGRASQLRVYNIYAAPTIGWHLYSPTVFSGSLSSNYIECFTDDNDYSRTCVEFIIYGNDSKNTAITQIDYKLSRPDLASSGSTVTKYGDQSLYHTFRWYKHNDKAQPTNTVSIDAESGNIYASSFTKSGGTSGQFLKADGSVDSNAYATTSALGNYLPLAGGQMNQGSVIKWTDYSQLSSSKLQIPGAILEYGSLRLIESSEGKSGGLSLDDSHLYAKHGSKTFTFPNTSGTLALTSAIPTVDATPTASSTNAVSSGGVYAELTDVVHEGNQIGSESYVDSGNVVTDLSGYATKAWVEAKGYLTTESDPGVYAWAKAATKPTYTASEVGALPDTTVIPTKLTQLTNDAGYIAGYTETDPTVPAWAKAANKPTYAASEITNDVGYLKYVLLQSESDMPANPDSGTLYLIPE